MNAQRVRTVGLVCFGLGLVMACQAQRSSSSAAGADDSSAGPSSGAAPSGMGQLAIDLVDAPNPQVDQIWVNVTEVTAHSTSAGWVTVSTTPVKVDLLELQSSAVALGLVTLPPGTITQVRLVVTEDGNYVVTGGQQVPLKVPSGSESGIKVKGPWEIAACAQTALTLDFDGKKSIWTHPTGQGDEWILRPVIRVRKVDSVPVGCMDGGGEAGGSDGGVPTACSESAPCPEGKACVAGVCQGGAGSPCVVGGECLSTVCDPTQRCGIGGPGTACAAPADCVSATCTAGVCAPGGPGTPCTTGNDCAAGTCALDGTCGPGAAGGTGHPCQANTECLSNACTAGVCAPGGQGSPCTMDPDCQEGLTCIAGACEPPVVQAQ
jgi:hypothetical protein